MRFVTIIVACVLLIGCQPGLIDDLPTEPPRIVVQGEPEDGKPWRIYVGHTYPTLDTAAMFFKSPGPLPGATVKLFDNDQFIEDLMVTGSPDSIQSFVSPNSPQQGHTYTLKVEAPNFNPVTATYTHPSPINIDDVDVEMTMAEVSSSGNNFTLVLFQYNVDVTFTDPPGDNYYQFTLTRSTGPDPSTSQYSVREYMGSRLPDLGGYGTMGGALIDDKKISGQKVTLPFQAFANTYVVADTLDVPYVTITLRTLSKEYYDFSKYLANPGPNYYDPYAQPSLVKTNVEGGLGVFAGYATSNYTFKLQKP